MEPEFKIKPVTEIGEMEDSGDSEGLMRYSDALQSHIDATKRRLQEVYDGRENGNDFELRSEIRILERHSSYVNSAIDQTLVRKSDSWKEV